MFIVRKLNFFQYNTLFFLILSLSKAEKLLQQGIQHQERLQNILGH